MALLLGILAILNFANGNFGIGLMCALVCIWYIIDD